MVSPFGEIRSETVRDDGRSCLLLVVVRMRDCSGTVGGIYEETFSHRSERVDVDGSENETVEGSESPGKDERRTLTWDAILI